MRVDNFRDTIQLFRSNTLDFVTLGYYRTTIGAAIGLPLTYLSNTKDELLKNEPPAGFNTRFGCFFKLNDIKEKSGQERLESFLDNLILSKEAKSFAFSKSLTESYNVVRDNYDLVFDVIVFVLSFWFVYARNRMSRNSLKQRKRMYIGVALIALTVTFFSKFFIYKSYDRLIDEEACGLGLDCCEGSLEYYDKLINQNKILRDVIPDGHEIIDEDGNYLKCAIQIPFTNFFIRIIYMGEKLTERRKHCKDILLETVIRLSKEAEAKTHNPESKNNQRSNIFEYFKSIFSKSSK